MIAVAALIIGAFSIVVTQSCGLRDIRTGLPPTPRLEPPPPTSALVGRMLQGTPCLPPCWEGITPGVSTMDEARQVMQRLRKTKQITSAECSETESDCTVIDKYGTSVVLSGDNGKIQYIRGEAQGDVYGGSLNVDAQKIVDFLGEPSWVVSAADPTRSVSCACDPVHAKIRYYQGGYNSFPLGVALLYPNHGAVFTFEVAPEDWGCICPYMRLVGFQYFTPVSSVAEYLDVWTKYNPYRSGPKEDPKEDGSAQWRGFGPIHSPPEGWSVTHPEK